MLGTNTTSVTPPLFIEVPLHSQARKVKDSIDVLMVWIVSTVWQLTLNIYHYLVICISLKFGNKVPTIDLYCCDAWYTYLVPVDLIQFTFLTRSPLILICHVIGDHASDPKTSPLQSFDNNVFQTIKVLWFKTSFITKCNPISRKNVIAGI